MNNLNSTQGSSHKIKIGYIGHSSKETSPAHVYHTIDSKNYTVVKKGSAEWINFHRRLVIEGYLDQYLFINAEHIPRLR